MGASKPAGVMRFWVSRVRTALVRRGQGGVGGGGGVAVGRGGARAAGGGDHDAQASRAHGHGAAGPVVLGVGLGPGQVEDQVGAVADQLLADVGQGGGGDQVHGRVVDEVGAGRAGADLEGLVGDVGVVAGRDHVFRVGTADEGL